nr:DENN domain-containing protein 11-like [Rhipicephalus microplus]
MARRKGATDRAPLLSDDEPIDGYSTYTNISCQMKCQLGPVSPRTNNRTGEKLVDNTVYDIVGVFVIAFDTRAGNTVEWWTPDDLDVSGIEFKAMTSGAHRVHTDFIYFKRKDCYGLSCFENMKVENEEERGARMKSIGILAKSYSLLHLHKTFLQKQVRQLLETPGLYEDLIQFYLAYQTPPLMDTGLGASYKTICDGMHSMEITHPAGCFSQFLNFFGEKVFLLWKFALLKKGFFFSPPPIGVICYRGTTEKIFDTKQNLFDLFVDQQNLKVHYSLHERLLELSAADKLKYNHLLELRSKCQPLLAGNSDATDESWFTGFFMAQNTQLFKELLVAYRSPEKLWTEEHMQRVGLDPHGDKLFLTELVERYGIDIVLITGSVCCPAVTL